MPAFLQAAAIEAAAIAFRAVAFDCPGPSRQSGPTGVPSTAMRALRFIALLLLAGMALLAFIPTASTSDLARWRVVKSKSVSGQFAATGTSATLRRPKGAAVRFLGRNVQGGRVFWACRKGVSVASWQESYRWGLHVLRHVRGKDSCRISAGASSEGRITVQILELL
jgi:hypothetical protein